MSSSETTFGQELGRLDHILTLLIIMLLCLGLTMVLSAGGVMPGLSDKYYFFKRQLIFAGAGGLGPDCGQPGWKSPAAYFNSFFKYRPV